MSTSKWFLPSAAQVLAVALIQLQGCAVSGARLPPDAESDADAVVFDSGVTFPIDLDADVTRPDAAPPIPTCIEAEFPAVPAPLELLILLDRSGSMITGDRWDVAKSTLLAFADTSSLDQLYLSLFMFPMWEAGDRECSARLYAYPLVPPRATPEVALDLKDAFRVHVDPGRTPLRLAVEGAIHYAKNRQERSFRQRALVLVTDGEGNACQSSTAEVVQLVTDAREEASILTFAVGMDGAVEEYLTQIAKAGGTESALMISEGENATPELSAALQTVRAEATACAFQLPEPQTGRLEPSSVSVRHRLPDGTGATWPLLDRKERCEGGTLGFYFDSALEPRQVILCPDACAIARAEPATQPALHAGCVWVVE